MAGASRDRNGRPFPDAVASEHALVGTVFTFPAAFDSVNGISGRYFTDRVAGAAFDAARALYDDTGSMDLVFVLAEVSRFYPDTTPQDLTAWCAPTPSPSLAPRHAAAIMDAWRRKRLVEELAAASERVMAGDGVDRELATIAKLGAAQAAEVGDPAVDAYMAALIDRDGLDALPRPGWLLPGWIPEAALVMLYGPPGHGKTFVALNMALAFAVGTEAFGMLAEPVGVLYVATEGASMFGVRVAAWEDRVLGGQRVDPRRFQVAQEPIDLLDKASADLLTKVVERGGFGFVVIDTLARCTLGADENAGKEMGPAFDVLHRVRLRTGVTIQVVHHTGKDLARGARGWSGMPGAVDTMIEMVDNKLTLTKQKDAEGEKSLDTAKYRHAESIVVDLATGPGKVIGSDRVALTLEVLQKRTTSDTGLSATDWRNAAEEVVGIKRSMFYEYRTELVRRELVVKNTKGHYLPTDWEPLQASLLESEEEF